jgi:hypothetical protein
MMMLTASNPNDEPSGLPTLSPDLVARARASDVPLDGTQCYHDIGILKALDEPKANELHDRHEQEVRLAWRGVGLVAAQQAAILVAANDRAVQHNAPIEDAVAAEKLHRDDVIALHRDRLLVFENQHLPLAHALAADFVAQTERPYDPRNPADATVLSVTPPSLKAIAMKEGLPYPPQDTWAQVLHKAAPVLCMIEAGLGLLMGLGYNAWTNHLHGRALERLSPSLCCYFLGGLSLAVAGSLGIWWLSDRTAYHYYRRLPATRWVPWLVATVLASILFVATDTWLQTHGLGALAQAVHHVTSLRVPQDAGQGSTGSSWWVGLCLSTFVTILAISHGGRDGCRDAVMPQIEARQEQERRWMEKNRANQPLVKQALRALALVRTLIHQVREEKEAIEIARQACDERCAHLDNGRLPVLDANDPTVNRPIRDTFDKACEVHEQWRRDFAALLGRHVQWEAASKL